MQPDPVLDIFREEAREHLGAVEKLFLDLETAKDLQTRRDLINNLFRHAHSLKGDAKIVGLTNLKEAAQELEDILDELRDKPEHVDRAAIDRSLAQFDKVRAAFEVWRDKGEAEREKVQPPAAEAAPAGLAEPALIPPASEESFTVRVPSERLDRMLNLAGEIRISQGYAETLSSRIEDLREHLATLARAIDRQTVMENRQEVEAALDRLQRIDRDLRKKHGREELLIEALEADIREARLLPLVMLADALRRAVRDLGQALGKSIKYQAEVGRILLDKAVLEALKDPLVHLLRNAADHGIETAAERRAAGKPQEGTIRLQASQQGAMVRITIADDGRGIGFDRIREHVRRLGQADENELAKLSERELAEHLFQPGFSTAPRGEISGRGVGLDVVRDTMRRLHGSVELQSSSAAGATFALTVPVTISTVRILSVLAGGQHYGIPTTAIKSTGRALRQDLRELAGHLVLPLGGQPVPWIHLAELLQGQSSQQARSAQASYVLLAHQGQQRAIAVDDLEDESEVLLKPLGFPLGGVSGIVGATIRANGSVQLVLDLMSAAWGKAQSRSLEAPAQRPQPGRVLVVDDSPTTRAILRNVFTAAGYAVSTATDGMDALERLQGQRVDLVVSDVEMPRLNGFDLTRQIKAKHGLPVILVTSREKEEQRREGLEAGADAYVVKSTFEGPGLLEIVRQFV